MVPSSCRGASRLFFLDADNDEPTAATCPPAGRASSSCRHGLRRRDRGVDPPPPPAQAHWLPFLRGDRARLSRRDHRRRLAAALRAAIIHPHRQRHADRSRHRRRLDPGLILRTPEPPPVGEPPEGTGRGVVNSRLCESAANFPARTGCRFFQFQTGLSQQLFRIFLGDAMGDVLMQMIGQILLDRDPLAFHLHLLRPGAHRQ